MGLNVVVKSVPQGDIKGQYECIVAPEGLTLRRKKRPDLFVPRGAIGEYLGGNRLKAQEPGRVLEIAVSKFGSYQNRLARDLAAFLSGQREVPNLADYRMEWYFYLVSVLPIGIPIITLGGALPAMLGFGLASGCFAIAQKDDWPVASRLLLCLGITAVAYVAVVALLVTALSARR
ncbi:MAG: hypothetical protein FJ290_26275 [Planctomycetes bacterium]|nr:hypothetical protein [Planctomycetota bacterium]